MIDKDIKYRTGFFLGGFGGYSGPSKQDRDISRAESRRDTPTSFSSNDDRREQYSAKQTSTGVVKGGGPAIKDDSGKTVGFEDRKITGDEGRKAQQEYLTATGVSQLDNLYNVGVPIINFPSVGGFGLNALKPFRDKMLRVNIDYFRSLKNIEARGYPKTIEGYKQYMTDRLEGRIDATGNPIVSTGGGNMQIQNALLAQQQAAIADPLGDVTTEIPQGGVADLYRRYMQNLGYTI